MSSEEDMPKENSSKKAITISLITIIIIAAVVLIYVNLPQTIEDNNNDGTNENGETNEEEILLTITYSTQELNYTLTQLENLTSYEGQGGKINKKSTITGPYNYTGVEISTFLNELDNLPEIYNITATSSDGYTQEYSYEQIIGNTTLYNETRIEIDQVEPGINILKMIVAYKEEGEYITDPEYAPLMVAFVDDYYTDSSLWARMLVSLEITEI